jgi:hypothetical protein
VQDYIVPHDDALVVRYKEQLDMLEKSTILYRSELLEYLKSLFLTRVENEQVTYTIDPSLTMDRILQIETDTRNTIINLYTNCEQYFIRALLIFEELYDNQSKQMNESRLYNLPLYQENMFTPTQPNHVKSNTFNMTSQPYEPFRNIPEKSNLSSEAKLYQSFNVSTPDTRNTSEPNSIPFIPAPLPFSLPVPEPSTIPEPSPEPSPEPNTVDNSKKKLEPPSLPAPSTFPAPSLTSYNIYPTSAKEPEQNPAPVQDTPVPFSEKVANTLNAITNTPVLNTQTFTNKH